MREQDELDSDSEHREAESDLDSDYKANVTASMQTNPLSRKQQQSDAAQLRDSDIQSQRGCEEHRSHESTTQTALTRASSGSTSFGLRTAGGTSDSTKRIASSGRAADKR